MFKYSNTLVHLDFKDIFLVATLFFALFPWLSFGLNTLDSQVYVLIPASLYILMSLKQNITKIHIGLLILLGSLILFSSVNINSVSPIALIRALIQVFMFCVVLIIAKENNHLLPNVIFFCNFIYLVVASFQLLGIEIFDFLSQNRTNSARGVTSLAPEPTFFGYALLILMVLNFFEYKKRRTKRSVPLFFCVANILFIIFAATSAGTIIYFPVIVLILLLSNLLSLKDKALVIAIGSVGVLVFIDNFGSTRLLSVFNSFIDLGITETIRLDPSITYRVSQIVLPILISLENFLIPIGEASLSDVDLSRYSLFFYDRALNEVAVFIPSMIFHFGAIGIIFLFILFRQIKVNKSERFYLYFFFLVFLSTATLTIGSTLVAIMFAYNYNRSDEI